jgi:hypothetical protein
MLYSCVIANTDKTQLYEVFNRPIFNVPKRNRNKMRAIRSQIKAKSHKSGNPLSLP